MNNLIYDPQLNGCQLPLNMEKKDAVNEKLTALAATQPQAPTTESVEAWQDQADAIADSLPWSSFTAQEEQKMAAILDQHHQKITQAYQVLELQRQQQQNIATHQLQTNQKIVDWGTECPDGHRRAVRTTPDGIEFSSEEKVKLDSTAIGLICITVVGIVIAVIKLYQSNPWAFNASILIIIAGLLAYLHLTKK